MLPYILCPLVVLGTTLFFARRITSRNRQGWVVLLGLWLCVPVGFALYVFTGLGLAHLLDCHISAAAPSNCTFLGINLSQNWLDGILLAGFALAFVAVPWTLIGGALILVAALFQYFSRPHTP